MLNLSQIHRVASITVAFTALCYVVLIVLNPPRDLTAALIPFATAVVIFVTFWVNLQVNIRLKGIDALIHCNKLYDDIKHLHRIRLIESTSVINKAAVIDYYRRFWSFQLEQFYIFRMGLIPKTIYRYYMQSRYDEFKENESIAGLSFLDGWHAARQYILNTEFEKFMNLIKENPDSAFRELKHITKPNKAADSTR